MLALSYEELRVGNLAAPKEQRSCLGGSSLNYVIGIKFSTGVRTGGPHTVWRQLKFQFAYLEIMNDCCESDCSFYDCSKWVKNRSKAERGDDNLSLKP